MSKIIEKINEHIGNVYTVVIKSSSDVYVDDFEKGEGDHRNSWDNDKVTFHVEPENLKTELLTNLENYIDDELYGEFSIERLKESIDNQAGDDECFWWHKCVDVNNTVACEAQIKDWKNGDIELFNENINIGISINSTDLTIDLLSELLFSEN